MSNEDEARFIQERAYYAGGGTATFAERSFENIGLSTAMRLGYPYRGADHIVAAIVEAPQSESWAGPDSGGEPFEGRLLRAALDDLAILPRLREVDMTLTYSAAPGVALVLNDARVAVDSTYATVQGAGKGRDVLVPELEGYRVADAYHHQLRMQRDDLQEEIGTKDLPADQLPRLLAQLNEVEAALLEAGVNAGIRQGAIEDDLKMLALANESIGGVRSCKGDGEKTAKALERLRDKRKTLVKVEQAVTGVNEAARFLPQLVSMQTDMGGIIKVFTGQDPSIATHLLRFVSLSPALNQATTVAMREILRLCYTERDASGNVVHDSAIVRESALTGKPLEKSLTAAKYTPGMRDRFFQAWEDAVVKELEGKGVEGALKLAEDAVSFSCLLMEMFTLGQTGYVRDRKTGELIDEAHRGINPGDGGSGSMYDHGGVDTVDKVHQLHDRKQAEALKGRIAPRPGVIKGLSQELLFSIFQYTEAKNSAGTGLGMSVLEALTSGGGDYTIGDFVENMFSGGHFSYMLFAFRACQISDKLDQLVNGRISLIKELGGGPEKLVEEMIDSLQGLAKAFQTIPFGRGAIQPWMAGSETDAVSRPAKDIKRVEITRNIVNLLADFYRGATASTPGAGGYEDNQGFRGLVDSLPVKAYERLVVYTNLLTPQQFHLAIGLAKDNGTVTTGGVLTDEMVFGDTEAAKALRKVLLQDPAEVSESLVNLVTVYGHEGTATNANSMESALTRVINMSADTAKKATVMPEKTLVAPARTKNPRLKVRADSV